MTLALGAADDRVRASTGDAVDVAFVSVLGLIGVVGFRTVYGGWSWLLIGGLGLAVGIAIGVVGARRRLDTLTVAALVTVAYFLLSGVVIPDHAIGGVIPTLATLRDAATGAVSGWTDLLTTVPPIGRLGRLGVIPLGCALIAGVLSTSAALRTNGLWRPVLPMIAMVVATILLGTAEPASLLLQGACFGIAVIGWMAHRHREGRTVGGGSGWWRSASAAAMLALACLAAVLAGDRLPGAQANERFVLRDQTEPPFDPRNHPSPLASFRRYKGDEEHQLRDETVFTVSGLPEGVPMRLAVLDTYDGVVWKVAGGPDDPAGSSGVFERVGETIPTDASGTPAQVEITVGEYDDIWLPDFGSVTGVSFGGPRAGLLTESLRFNRVTDVGAAPARFRKGDRITIDAVWREWPSESTQDPASHAYAGRAAGSSTIDVANLPPELRDLADRIVTEGGEVADGDGAAAPGFDRALRLAREVIDGPSYGYCDGLADETGCDSVAGHSLRRMQALASDVLEQGLTSGNGEQYASALALMSRSVGVPARIVMGFCPTGCPGDDVVVTGEQVAAWVEVDIDGLGWVPLQATPSPDKQLQQVAPKPRPTPQDASQPPPPPITTPPPEVVVAEAEDAEDENEDENEDDALLNGVPLALVAAVAAPVLVIGGVVTGVLALKRRRQRRRRRHGSAVDQVVGGWREFDDRAFDLGRPLPTGATRREIAGYLDSESARISARAADAAIFGPRDPSASEVEDLWQSVDDAYASLAAGSVARARGALNPASLFRGWRDRMRSVRGREAVRGRPEAGAGATPPDGDRTSEEHVEVPV